MTAQDAAYAAQWQKDHGFTLDMVFNAGSGEEWKSEHGGTDALADRMLADKAQYRWVNHTYTHPYLGCVQDTTNVPWSCAKNPDGTTKWMSRAEISAQIADNHNWARARGLTLDRTELVTGEHSGLKSLPQQPQDNPNLAGALADNGVKWAASDNSREPEQRAVGSALTVPRYPMNVYYNVGTKAEMADEYNWVYTSRADGGSGACEDNPASTCLDAPLDTATGYDSYIVPPGGPHRPRPRHLQRPEAALRPPVQPRRGPHPLPGPGEGPRRLPGPVRGQHPAGEPAAERHRHRAEAPRRLAGRHRRQQGHGVPHRQHRHRQGPPPGR
ncbi:hypothetical protein GCM10020256_56470 [Streptomyces thermocoprophilus]